MFTRFATIGKIKTRQDKTRQDKIKWQNNTCSANKICSVTISQVEEVYVILAVLLTLTMQKRGRPERDSNHDLSDAGGVLHQLSSQNNLELVVM